MILSKSKIFLYCCLGFIVGVGIASFLPTAWLSCDLYWFGAAALFFVVVIWQWPRQVWLLFIVFLILGSWRYGIGLIENTPDKIWFYNGQQIVAQGIVNNEPDIRNKNQKLELSIKKIKRHDANLANKCQSTNCEYANYFNAFGKILVTTDLYPAYQYGDELEIACELQAPEAFSGFAYERYLARYDIYSVCYYPRLRPVCLMADQGFGGQARPSADQPADQDYGGQANFSSDKICNSGNWFYKKIFQLKDKLRGIINQGLTEPSASFTKAIILGDKKGLPVNLREQFSQAGISHLVAISGMHISIIAAMVMLLLLGLGMTRRYAFYLAILFLGFYIILIGLPASAMRAGLMGFLVLWALHLGRLSKLTNTLVLAATVLLLFNPKLLRDDIGFQLSFLALAGIVYIYPLAKDWLDKKEWLASGKGKLNKLVTGAIDILLITLAVQVFTLPILAYNFSQISLIAPLTNLLVLWTLPLLMTAVLIALGLSLLLPGWAVVFFLPVRLLELYIIKIADWLTQVPYSYIIVDYIAAKWVFIYYLIAIVTVIYFNKKAANLKLEEIKSTRQEI